MPGIGSPSWTSKDYDVIRQEVINRIPSITKKWTDWNPTDIGITILELFSGIFEELGYYQDDAALEGFIRFALQRKNVYEIVRPVGYKPQSLVAAYTNVIFFINAPHTKNIVLSKYTNLRTMGITPVTFVTMEDATILAGDTEAITYRALSQIVEFVDDGSNDKFRVTSGGDHTLKFVAGSKVTCTLGTAVTIDATVVTSSYAGGITQVQIDTASLDNTLESVKYSSGNIEVKQGSFSSETFTITPSTPDLNLSLASAVVAEGSIDVYVGITDQWTYVDSLVDSGPTDKHYTLELDWNNIFTIVFGDGVYGKAPDATTVTVNYITTNGSQGNVGANRISFIIDEVKDTDNVAQDVYVNNPTGAIGGTDVQDIEMIRLLAPARAVSQDRGTTTSDIAGLVLNVPGVGEAKAYDIKDTSGIPFKTVWIYAIPEGATGGEQISSGMETAIDNALVNKILAGTLYEIKDVDWVAVDFTVNLYVYASVLTPTYTEAYAKADVSNAINAYLSIETLEIGDNVTISGLIQAINSVRSPNNLPVVANMSLSLSVDVAVNIGQMAMPGSITINVSGTV